MKTIILLSLFFAASALVTTNKSKSIPFLPRPPLLDGSMAGDVGFDPFGLAENPTLLGNYREAEIRHCRIAMLAAAGWPLSELFDRSLAKGFNLPTIVDINDRAPSVLNGGLGKISGAYWITVLLAASFVEAYTLQRKRTLPEGEYYPGNLGFDPLGLYPKGDADKAKIMQLAEIKNGRLAMIAIFGFAIQEFVYKTGVIDQTPFFFKIPFTY